MFSRRVALVFLFLLAGCVSVPSSAPEQENTIIKRLEFITDKLKFSLISPYDLVAIGVGKLGYFRVGPKDEFPAFRTWGCARDRDRLDVIMTEVLRYCSSVGGRLHGDLKLGLNKSWCVNQAEIPLFMVRVGRASNVLEASDLYCTSGNDFGVYAVTGELATNQSYWSDWAALNLGYLTPTEVQRQQQVQSIISSRLNAAKARDAAMKRDAVLSSPIGTRVCHLKGDYRYLGNIEQKSGRHVKVFVVDAHLIGEVRMKPGGFRQHYIWNEAGDWHLC